MKLFVTTLIILIVLPVYIYLISRWQAKGWFEGIEDKLKSKKDSKGGKNDKGQDKKK